MKYYIADCHFYHASLNEQMDKRGFESEAAMNEYMLKQWNSRVGVFDDVYILGDLCLGNAEHTNELLSQLNGQLYMLMGNHDLFGKNKKYDVSRFRWIKSYAEIHDNNRKVILCHYPVMCYNGQYRRDEKGIPTTYMLYGHVHNTKDAALMDDFVRRTRTETITTADGITRPIPCQMINCFCKFSDYVPLTLDEWIKVTEERLYPDENHSAN